MTDPVSSNQRLECITLPNNSVVIDGTAYDHLAQVAQENVNLRARLSCATAELAWAEECGRKRDAGETTQQQVIQHVYTRGGRAAVTGIPGPDHDCDQMACSSLEHIIARVPHTVDEPPEKAVETASPQMPIARVIVREDEPPGLQMYAPGLPPGAHELYCEPEAVAPYMRAAKAVETPARQPDGYAYRYPTLRDDVADIRFDVDCNGGEQNGRMPVETIPYYFGSPLKAAETKEYIARGTVGSLSELSADIELLKLRESAPYNGPFHYAVWRSAEKANAHNSWCLCSDCLDKRGRQEAAEKTETAKCECGCGATWPSCVRQAADEKTSACNCGKPASTPDEHWKHAESCPALPTDEQCPSCEDIPGAQAVCGLCKGTGRISVPRTARNVASECPKCGNGIHSTAHREMCGFPYG